MTAFQSVADGVYVRRHRVLDVNSSLILGAEHALLVDTLSTPDEARDLARDVRELTGLPISVVNTHFHFDHTFGNATIADLLGVTEFWAHSSVIETLTTDADEVRAGAHRACLELAPQIAETVRTVELLPPNREVGVTRDLDLGGRTVRLWHPGTAHSPGDLVVLASDVVLAGDLIEEGAPPNTNGADLANWPRVIEAMLPHMTGPVIPGHGAVVDADFARHQALQLAALTN
ncbi:MAG: MBL fold metallo-hydrolase [Stackebrandtia sp.]